MALDRYLWILRLVAEVIRLILDHLTNGGDPAPLANIAARWAFDASRANTLRDVLGELDAHPDTAPLAAQLRETLPDAWLV